MTPCTLIKTAVNGEKWLRTQPHTCRTSLDLCPRQDQRPGIRGRRRCLRYRGRKLNTARAHSISVSGIALVSQGFTTSQQESLILMLAAKRLLMSAHVCYLPTHSCLRLALNSYSRLLIARLLFAPMGSSNLATETNFSRTAASRSPLGAE